MMFICDPCHKKSYTCTHFSGSYGKCEDCGKAANCHDCDGSSPIERPKRKRKKKAAPANPKVLVEFTMSQLAELGLLGCENCIEATGHTHPPTNHFTHGDRPCAHCKCKSLKTIVRFGKQITRRPQVSKDPDIQYAAENADMVRIIRQQVEEAGITSVPFLDDCVELIIKDRKEAREALTQVKVDHLNKKAKLPMKTHAMIEHALVKE